MDHLYLQTKRIVQDLQGNLGSLERASAEEASRAENEIQSKLDQLYSNCEKLEILANKEPASRRHNAKLKVNELKYDGQHLNAGLQHVRHRRMERDMAEREREALLTRRFTTNDDTSVTMDPHLQHNQSLMNAHRGIDDLLSSGSATLSNLKDQHGRLKGAQKKLLDVMNTLGLSNTVMRLIERRTTQDRYIFWAGVALTCFIMFLAVRYLL